MDRVCSDVYCCGYDWVRPDISRQWILDIYRIFTFDWVGVDLSSAIKFCSFLLSFGGYFTHQKTSCEYGSNPRVQQIQNIVL